MGRTILCFIPKRDPKDQSQRERSSKIVESKGFSNEIKIICCGIREPIFSSSFFDQFKAIISRLIVGDASLADIKRFQHFPVNLWGYARWIVGRAPWKAVFGRERTEIRRKVDRRIDLIQELKLHLSQNDLLLASKPTQESMSICKSYGLRAAQSLS